MSLAKADMGVARLYAALATGPGDDRRWDAIETEYRRTVALLARVTGTGAAARWGAGPATLGRAAEPVRGLAVRAPGPAARAAPGAAGGRPRAPRVLRLVQLTVNGVAAGLQSTG